MNEFKCPICEKIFSSDSILEVHQVSAHRSAQDAMNRQQEEIKELLKIALKRSYNSAISEVLEVQRIIIQVLAKMNGVEDALK